MGSFLDDMNKLLQTISLIGVMRGGLFSVIKWFRSQQLKRNEYIYSLLEKINSDEDIIKGIYKIQYDDEWYEPSFHDENDDNSFKLELQVDKVLSFFPIYVFCIPQRQSVVRKWLLLIIIYVVHLTTYLLKITYSILIPPQRKLFANPLLGI